MMKNTIVKGLGLLLVVIAFVVALSACSGKSNGAGGLDVAIREASDYLNDKIPKRNKIAILNVESDSPSLSTYIVRMLTANAADDEIFSVVDREQIIDLVRMEQALNVGELDDNSALEIGKFAGAQTIVLGSIKETGGNYRLTIRALDAQTGQEQGMFNRNIAAKILNANYPPDQVSLTFPDGTAYEGDWVNGNPHGRGKKVFADGDVYEGDFANGTFHGKGKYTYTNGIVYQGDWVDGKARGKGKVTSPDGDVYEGDFLDGRFNGRGKYTYADGTVQEGVWKDGDFVQ